MKYIGEDAARLLGGKHTPIPSGFAPMLIEVSKNIGKSRDKSYPTDQKTSSILVPTTAKSEILVLPPETSESESSKLENRCDCSIFISDECKNRKTQTLSVTFFILQQGV